ncbi:unnamed protein product [Pleuronectes platessa]|uniref:Uncharacterized protein n=1 Tax=Pleuronectes platessa TaxID=8262 RepID=A0A9N7UFP9_PLEPL|nr:unnamed protein product [Pleuronectes platessa]
MGLEEMRQEATCLGLTVLRLIPVGNGRGTSSPAAHPGDVTTYLTHPSFPPSLPPSIHWRPIARSKGTCGNVGLRGRAGPVLNPALSWIKFTVLLGLIKRIPLADEHGSCAPGLALLPAGSVFSRHCAAPQHLLVRPQAADVPATFHPKEHDY